MATNPTGPLGINVGGTSVQFQNYTPAQLAAAYAQWIAQNGGDTEANQQAAKNYLMSQGVSPELIEQAHGIYKTQIGGQTTGPAAPTPIAASVFAKPRPVTQPVGGGVSRNQPGVINKSPFDGMTKEQIVAKNAQNNANYRGTGKPRPGLPPGQRYVEAPPPDTSGLPGNEGWWNEAVPLEYTDRTGKTQSIAGKSRAAMMEDIAQRFAGQQYWIENGDSARTDPNAPTFATGWYDPGYLQAMEKFYNENRQYAGPDGKEWGELPTLDYNLIGSEMRKSSGLSDDQLRSANNLTGADRMNAINSMAGATKNASGTWNNSGRQQYRWAGTKAQQNAPTGGVPVGTPVGKPAGGAINNVVAPPSQQVAPGQSGPLGVMNRYMARKY